MNTGQGQERANVRQVIYIILWQVMHKDRQKDMGNDRTKTGSLRTRQRTED
jgi:hypothetical protein